MDAELRELCERLRGLLAKVPAGELTAADEKNNIGNGMTMHFSVVKGPDGKNIIRLGYTDPYVHLFAASVNALPHLLDTLAAQAAELEGVRKDAELGRYIRLTADQRAQGLSEAAFSIRVENAIKRRQIANTAIADSGAGGGA